MAETGRRHSGPDVVGAQPPDGLVRFGFRDVAGVTRPCRARLRMRRATERTSLSRLDGQQVDTRAAHGDGVTGGERSEPAVVGVAASDPGGSTHSGIVNTPETEADQEGVANPVH